MKESNKVMWIIKTTDASLSVVANLLVHICSKETGRWGLS